MTNRPQDTPRKTLFADETTTGKDHEQLRGLRRITVAAKCASGESFEWLRRFNHDYLTNVKEIKSSLVLAVIGGNRSARNDLIQSISTATIAIIDLSEHTRWLFRELQAATGVKSDGVKRGVAFLRSGTFPKELVEGILRWGRRDAIHKTAVGRIEHLVSVAAEKCNIPLGKSVELFDRAALDELSEQEFSEFAGRFALALADAFHPETQAKVITDRLADMRFCHAGHVALSFLEAAVEPDQVFDMGSSNAFALLERAHTKVIDAVSTMRIAAGQFSPGKLAQEDSEKLLGLQAADIAAGLARQTLERDFATTVEGARAVKSIFSRVLLNDRWVEEYE